MREIPEVHHFSCRSARSPAILGTLAALIVVETAALHLLLTRWAPWAAWGLTAASLSALVWLLADDRALKRNDALIVDGTHVHVNVGRRLAGSFERAAVREVRTPTWKDPGRAPRAFNATKPAAPNALIVLTAPRRMRVLGGLERPIERLALHLDAPSEFIALLSGNP